MPLSLGQCAALFVREQLPRSARRSKPATMPLHALCPGTISIDSQYTLNLCSGMQPDPQPSNKRQRLIRATGAAVGVGVGLMENSVPGSGGRLMVFTGGPCTTGPGTVVGPALEESIRTHRV